MARGAMLAGVSVPWLDSAAGSFAGQFRPVIVQTRGRRRGFRNAKNVKP